VGSSKRDHSQGTEARGSNNGRTCLYIHKVFGFIIQYKCKTFHLCQTLPKSLVYFSWCRQLSINLAWHLNDNFLAGVPALTWSCCFHVNILEAKRRLRSTFSTIFFSMVHPVHIFLICITRLFRHFIKALNFGGILLSCVTLYFDLV